MYGTASINNHMTILYRYTTYSIPEDDHAAASAWVFAEGSQATLITTQLGDQLEYRVSIRDLDIPDHAVTDKSGEFSQLFPGATLCE